ncbi:MAG: hypothetical protein C5B57_02215 [Blastocatellia bacterium]|nr:MAG: hypothetical protein C5B57_02215 [Blastocatellia bacterium]
MDRAGERSPWPWSTVRRVLATGGVMIAIAGKLLAHDPSATITWNREVSRIVYERCASCHHPGGTSFSLMTYQDAQPRAAAIKASVLSRRMPPWGAVKGFGDFRDDKSLTQEQISLVTAWVEGGAPRGNNPNALPPAPKFGEPRREEIPTSGLAVSGDLTIDRPITVDGLWPEHVPPGASMQIVAAWQNGRVEPLLWLYEYNDSYRHPFRFRRAIEIPAGTTIRGVPRDAKIVLMTADDNSWFSRLRALFRKTG